MVEPVLIAALFISSSWLLYIAFFNAQVQGYLITWILRHLGYFKDSEIRFGSVSVSIIGGKVMFKELKYLTKDYAIRCVDGAFIFKWFTRLSPDDISRESQTWSLYHILFQSRALLTLQGLEVHIYNRTSIYDDLEKLAKSELDVGVPDENVTEDTDNTNSPLPPTEQKEDKLGLRNLIPVLVIEVQKGKFVVGNNLTETVMFVDIDTATAIYSTPTKRQLDPYMHMLRSKISKIRVTLNKSPGYKGLQETPPSQPEAGVPLLRSREVRLHYVQDVPGRVTNLQKSAESSPEWEMTIKFMKETVIHYGPWLDRQRDILYKFFYPPDYKVMEVSKPLKVGDLRRHQCLNVIIDFEAKSTLTILFFRDEQTSSINIDIENGSKIQMQIPWTVSQQGFTTQGVADLYRVQCHTSLDYRPFLEADEIHMMFSFQYPRVWHQTQTWGCDFLNVTRPVLHFVFDHVEFITDLINDWSPAYQPDLIQFVPYVWNFNFKFNDALVILPVSQHNWIDCIQNRIENSETVFFGIFSNTLDITFSLPFVNFQPQTTEMRFDFNAEDIRGCLWLPQYHTLRDSIKQFKMDKIPPWIRLPSDNISDGPHSSIKDKFTSIHDVEGWEECWSIQDLFLRFTFVSNSVVPFNRPGYTTEGVTCEDKANHLGVEVIIGPSIIRLYGVFFRHLWFFKDNYFGYDDKVTPLTYLYNRFYDRNRSTRVKRPGPVSPVYDLDVTCKVIVKDILGEIPRHCDEQNVQVKLPCVQIDLIEFELCKTSREAEMEVTVSPVNFLLADECKRPSRDLYLSHGFLRLNGVKVVMCGLYSGIGLQNPKNPFDYLEYGFLVEVTTGALVGRLSMPQIQHIVNWAEVFVWQCLDRENEMPMTEHQMNLEKYHVGSYKLPADDGTKSGVEVESSKKLSEEDLKYLMIKISVSHTDIYLLESGCVCNIGTKTVRVALCNAHHNTSTLGITVAAHGANLTQYIRLSKDEDDAENRSQWLQVGNVTIPPIMCDINKRLANPAFYMEHQRKFLKVHDGINQKLLFLWFPNEYRGCGCVGGVTFNNTSIVEVNGFYFEPLSVPADFCVCTQNSNTPWKTMSRNPDYGVSPAGSSMSSTKLSSDGQHEGHRFKEYSPSPRNSTGSDSKQKKPPSGKKKINSGYTTFPQRGERKRDKSKTLSHYNDILRNFPSFSLRRKSSKRKSKVGSDSLAGSEGVSDGNKTAVVADKKKPPVETDGGSVKSSNPSILLHTPSKDGGEPAAAPAARAEEVDNRRSSSYTVPPVSPTEQTRRYGTPGGGEDHRKRSSKQGTLSRSSSVDSFHSARSGWRTNDGVSSAGEEKTEEDEEEEEKEQVKDFSIPFPFQSDITLNKEIIDIYLDHLTKATMVETKLSNSVMVNRSLRDISDDTKIPHRMAGRHAGYVTDRYYPVEPSINQLLTLTEHMMPALQTGESVTISPQNLFSSGVPSGRVVDPRLNAMRQRWEKKLKSSNMSDVKVEKREGKIISIIEFVDPVDIFITPFCIEAINKYIQTAEMFYKHLHPAAVVNLVHASSAPTVLEVAIQHATAQRALLFSNHLPSWMKKFDNSLERTIEERLNLELFLSVPAVVVRTLQGGGDLQWLGTESELERTRVKTVKATTPRTDEEDEGFTDRSEKSDKSEKSDVSEKSEKSDKSDIRNVSSSDILCPNKVAKLSLVKVVVRGIDVSLCYHQFEQQKTMMGLKRSMVEGLCPGEYTQSACSLKLGGVFGQLHILHPHHSYFSDTFISNPKTVEVMSQYTQNDDNKKFGSKQTSIVFEFGAESLKVTASSLKRNLLVSLPEPPEQQQRPRKKHANTQDVDSFSLDLDSVDIVEGEKETTGGGSTPSFSTDLFGYKKLHPPTTIHYHSGPERQSNASYIDDAQEPLISDGYSDSEEVMSGKSEKIDYTLLQSEKEDEKSTTEKVSMGAEIAASLSSLSQPSSYTDKAAIRGLIANVWFSAATPSAEKTEGDNAFNPYTSLPHAIISWSVPGSLMAQYIKHLTTTKLARVQSVIAGILAEALGQESQYEPPVYTTKYSRLTIAAKTLKESSVIRLMNHLRYTINVTKNLDSLYHDLQQEAIPRRILLERGIQAMLAAIEGKVLQSVDGVYEHMPSANPSVNSNNVPMSPSRNAKDLEGSITDKTPVYYHGRQDYGSISGLDKISIGKPPQAVQTESKHRTHQQALMELLSSSDKAKLADKYFALYKTLDLRLPRADHINIHISISVSKTRAYIVDCKKNLDTDAMIPVLKLNMLSFEACFMPAYKEFSIPRPSKDHHPSIKPSDSRSSLRGESTSSTRNIHRINSTGSISIHSGISASNPPSRPPRKKKSKRNLEPVAVLKSIKHVVRHLVVDITTSDCLVAVGVDLLRLSKALVDGVSKFEPSSFRPPLFSTSRGIHTPPSPPPEPRMRSADEQFILTGCWERMNDYIQLMFRSNTTQMAMSPESERRSKPRVDRDIMLYTESPYIPVSITLAWRIERTVIEGKIQGLSVVTRIAAMAGSAAILQNLYVEMNNSPNNDIILEPLSPNVVSAILHDSEVSINFMDMSSNDEIVTLFCSNIPRLHLIYTFLPYVTRIQKLLVEIQEVKSYVPKPIVKIQNILMDSISLVLHEIKNFERYFQRSLQSLHTPIHDSVHKSDDISVNFIVRTSSLGLDLLPSLSLTHEIQDLYITLTQNKGLSLQVALNFHELFLKATELDTHLPLPQIFVKGEKVMKRDPSTVRSGQHGEYYLATVEIKTIQIKLPTSMLNHVIFVQNAFLKEINELLEAINVIRHNIETTTPLMKAQPPQSLRTPDTTLFGFNLRLQGIDLLAITPTGLALSLKTETINVDVKNKMVTDYVTVAKERQQIIERPKMFISTTITTDITLGTLADISPEDPKSLEDDMVKFLQFRATASLGNDEGILDNKLSANESFHAAIKNPQLYMKPGAFDKALLFYLNYKGAYEIFNDERQALNQEVLSATENFMSKINFPKAPPELPATTHLKMTVKNLAVCLPLYNRHDQSPGEELLSASLTEIPRGPGALSFSIRTADMKMSFAAAHVNVGSFNDFIIRFINNFDESSWRENAAPRSTDKETNSIAIDSGRYNYITHTVTPKVNAKEGETAGTAGKVCLSVGSYIKGVNIHLDTCIISRLVGLYKTLTSLVDDFTPDNDKDILGSEVEVDGVSVARSYSRVNMIQDSNIAIIAKQLKSSDRPINEKSKRALEIYFKEKEDELKMLRSSESSHHEIKNMEDQVDSVKKLIIKAYMQGTPVKHPSARKQRSKADELSMMTSKSVLKDESQSNTSSSTSSQQPPGEPPSLEFEMDFNVTLGYGKVNLYPLPKSEDQTPLNPLRRIPTRSDQDSVTENTEFLIPETQCKVHYTSTKTKEKTTVPSQSIATSGATSVVSKASAESDEAVKAIKSGALFANLKMLSLKQDQIIRPSFLEYLDQLLAGGSDPSTPSGIPGTIFPNEIEEILKDPIGRSRDPDPRHCPTPSSENSSTSKQTSTSTFPIDIIILVMIEPSTIKLSCLPFSRHECSVGIPRSHFILSTKGIPSSTILQTASGRRDIVISRDGRTSCWQIAGSLEECKVSLYHPLSQKNSLRSSRGLPAEVRNALSVTVSGGDLAITRITTPKQTEDNVDNGKQIVAYVSALTNANQIQLTYDIRRMDEIEAFYNAWLSGSFIKRLLLLSRPINTETSTPATPSSPTVPIAKANLNRNDRYFSTKERPESQVNPVTSIPKTQTDLPNLNEPDNRSPSLLTKSSDSNNTEIAETNLILAINSKEVTLTTNLGHTLGRIKLSVVDSKNKTSICLKERHNEKRKVEIFTNQVRCESTAGLITGLVTFWNLAGSFEHAISPDYPSKHMIQLTCGVFENKADYLNNCIFMIRVLEFKTELHDEWHSENDPFNLKIGGYIGWETIQTMVNSNTAPNALQIKAHFDDFIESQKKHSQRAYMRIFAQPTDEAPKESPPLKMFELDAQRLSHHWFWAVLTHAPAESIQILCDTESFTHPLKLGGSLKLSGKEIAVAIFQGDKFRDDTWTLISLNDVTMGYDTCFEEVYREDITTHVTHQNAVICMGNFDTLSLAAPNDKIGSVEKCVRNTKLTPPERTDSIAMWLRYACSHDFANGNPDRIRSTRATIFGAGSIEYSTIFQLPEMKLNLKTSHNWNGDGDVSPMLSTRRLTIPVVHCKLKSQFRGSIGLATNAAHYFFLHDLAQRYTKRMEKYMDSKSTSTADVPTITVQNSQGEVQDKDDWDLSTSKRKFVCDEWELTPQLRLQGGGRVEFQVDWLLNKLGFKNPKVTIPKWIQRGPMDPLDFFVSGLVRSLVFQQSEIVKETKVTKKHD